MMRHIFVILWKEMKDTLKNKTILIQFILFPVMTIIMENAMDMKGMPEHFFASLFGVMYVGMAPLTSVAAIISEEKEKNTLRVLWMSNVKPVEYLLGVGIYIWIICMIGVCIIAFAGGYTGITCWNFIWIMAVGLVVSIVMGAVIGTWSNNQMMATSITMPVMMIFSFLPMLSMFNETIAKIAKITYSEQLRLLVNQADTLKVGVEPIAVVVGNLLVSMLLFGVAFRRRGLD